MFNKFRFKICAFLSGLIWGFSYKMCDKLCFICSIFLTFWKSKPGKERRQGSWRKCLECKQAGGRREGWRETSLTKRESPSIPTFEPDPSTHFLQSNMRGYTLLIRPAWIYTFAAVSIWRCCREFTIKVKIIVPASCVSQKQPPTSLSPKYIFSYSHQNYHF